MSGWRLARSILLFLAFSTAASARQLTATDVRELLAAAGLNPGTIRLINERGLHQLISVRVSGKNGKWQVIIHEREIQRSSQKEDSK